MAFSVANSAYLNNLSTPELIFFIRTRAFMKSQFDEIAQILYSRKQITADELLRLNLANLKVQGWCSALESECNHLRNLYLEVVNRTSNHDSHQNSKCADLNNKIPNIESVSSLHTKITEIEGKLKEEDWSVLLDGKYREMENAKSFAESRCSFLESQCALFRNRCADLEKMIKSCHSSTGLCSMITEIQSNLNEEKDKFRLLDQKYMELERFSSDAKEEAIKYKRMSDQLQKHVENVEKELALLRARDQRGQEEVHQWKCKFSELEVRILKSFDENLNLKANLGKALAILSSKEKELTLLRARDQREQEEFHELKCKCSKLEVQILKLFDENLELQTNLKKENRIILSSDDHINQEHQHQIHDSAKLRLIAMKEENNHKVFGQLGNGSSTQIMISRKRNADSDVILDVNSAPTEEDFSNTSAMLESSIAKLDRKGKSKATKKSQ